MDCWMNISNRGTATIPKELWTNMGCPDQVFVSVDPVFGYIYMSTKDPPHSEPRSLFSKDGNRSPQVSLSGIIRKMGIERVMAGHRHVTYFDGSSARIELCNFWRDI